MEVFGIVMLPFLGAGLQALGELFGLQLHGPDEVLLLDEVDLFLNDAELVQFVVIVLQ